MRLNILKSMCMCRILCATVKILNFRNLEIVGQATDIIMITTREAHTPCQSAWFKSQPFYFQSSCWLMWKQVAGDTPSTLSLPSVCTLEQSSRILFEVGISWVKQEVKDSSLSFSVLFSYIIKINFRKWKEIKCNNLETMNL